MQFKKYCRMLHESILQYFWPALILLSSLSGCLRQVLLYQKCQNLHIPVYKMID